MPFDLRASLIATDSPASEHSVSHTGPLAVNGLQDTSENSHFISALNVVYNLLMPLVYCFVDMPTMQLIRPRIEVNIAMTIRGRVVKINYLS